MLITRLVNYNQDTIDKYNESFRDIVENIRDFITLHFVCPRRDTEFWRKVADTKLPSSLEQNLKIWRHKMPVEDDFEKISKSVLFKELHYIFILHGLQLFDQTSIKKEYDTLPNEAKEYVLKVLEDLENANKIEQDDVLTHKEMLSAIRSYK